MWHSPSSHCNMVLQAKVAGKACYAGSFPGYDDYVPMVDKVVDAVGCMEQTSIPRPATSKG